MRLKQEEFVMSREGRREMVMEKRNLWKVSNLGDVGFLSSVLDGSPAASKERSHQIPAPHVSQQV